MKNKKAPEYPNYLSACNGCGQCCKTIPCPTALEYGLWRFDKCRALSFKGGRYWCNVVVSPVVLGGCLSAIKKEERINMIGVVGICDAKKIDGVIANQKTIKIYLKNKVKNSRISFIDRFHKFVFRVFKKLIPYKVN